MNQIQTLAQKGEQLRQRDRLAEAEAVCRQALRLDPTHLAAANTLGQILIQTADWPALRREMERRVAHLPGDQGLWERSNITLLFGDLPLGWQQYEARFRIPGLIKPQRDFPQPRWEGGPFPGRTLLLHWEQGQGDSLMFIRFAALAKALGGRVLVEVQPSVAGVAATCPGVDQVIPYGEPLPPFDLQASLMSLPAILGTTLEGIPAAIPYLDVPAQVPNREPIARILAATHGLPRLGLVWAGNASNPYDPLRSIPAAALAPLAALPGVAWHSFQPGLATPPPFERIIPLGPLLSTFSDTAYALSAMDLVVTVDTAVAHLAGALGIPTLVLVECLPDWRWLMGRPDSPWYPTLELWRQPTHGDWTSVIRRMAAELAGGQP